MLSPYLSAPSGMTTVGSQWHSPSETPLAQQPSESCKSGKKQSLDSPVVIFLGYNTAKGDLVRSILYPRPLNFKLYNEAFKFMVFLACIGVVGFFYGLGVYMYHEVSTVTKSCQSKFSES